MKQLLRTLPKLNTVVHVGSHEGQEVPYYLQSGAKVIHLIDPLPSVYDKLIEKFANQPEVFVSKSLCLDYCGTTKFYTTTNEVSSSIYSKHNPNMCDIQFNEGYIEVQTVTLDSLTRTYERIDLLVIDAQSSEDKVLCGAEKTLKITDRVFIEVSEKPLYENACLIGDVDLLLGKSGFKRIETYLNSRGTGDALYGRDESISPIYGT